jgi:hypothetical protein
MSPATEAVLTMAPAALREHARNLRLHAEPDAGEVHGEDAGPRLGVIVGGTGLVAGNAGVVEGAVEPPQPAHRLVHHGGHVGLARDVGAHEAGLAPRRLDEAHRLVAGFRGHVGHGHPGPLAREGERRRAADSGGGAGDERDAARERGHPSGGRHTRVARPAQ